MRLKNQWNWFLYVIDGDFVTGWYYGSTVEESLETETLTSCPSDILCSDLITYLLFIDPNWKVILTILMILNTLW